MAESESGPAAHLPFAFPGSVRTPRLRLRVLCEDDVDDVHAYQSREDVCRFLLFEPRTRAQVSESLARHSRVTTLARDGDCWRLAMELPTAGGSTRVAGDVFFALSSVEHLGGEIGWTLHPDYHRRGLATEAVAALLDLAFGPVGLHRVRAEVDPRNDASIALSRRLGMRQEAHHRGDIWFRGAWADTFVYAVLAHEWHERQRAQPPR